jgi:hypothetical protein
MPRSRTTAWTVAWIVLASGWVVVTSLSASASCAAPTVKASPRSVSPGDPLAVSGEYWITTCNDTPGGCEASSSDPYRDISITIRPADVAGREVTLGTVDAIDHEFTFRLETTVPDLPPGKYVVEARAADPVGEAGQPAELRVI